MVSVTQLVLNVKEVLKTAHNVMKLPELFRETNVYAKVDIIIQILMMFLVNNVSINVKHVKAEEYLILIALLVDLQIIESFKIKTVLANLDFMNRHQHQLFVLSVYQLV